MLDVRLGAGDDQPGVSPARPGGIPERGPRSIAVDHSGQIYIWDSAKGRILRYTPGVAVPGIIEAPGAPEDARGLLVVGPYAYLRMTDDAGRSIEEFEIGMKDARVGRSVLLRRSVVAATGPLYPRERPAGPFTGFQTSADLGRDDLGNHYEVRLATSGTAGTVVRRHDGRGTVFAQAPIPFGAEIVDRSVTHDGAVYQLQYDRAGSAIAGIFVSMALPKAGDAFPVPTPRPAPAQCGIAAAPSPPTTAPLKTIPGELRMIIGRDDSYRRPALVPSWFLFDFTPADISYEYLVCRDIYVSSGGLAEGTRAIKVYGDPPPRPSFPPGVDVPSPSHALWIVGWHVIRATVDASGNVTVVLEPRSGFERAVFAVDSIAPKPRPLGHLSFRFVDPAGRRVAPAYVQPVDPTVR